MADEQDLKAVREAIDGIDREIQALINRRARCAQQVAEIKLGEQHAARERGEDPGEVGRASCRERVYVLV